MLRRKEIKLFSLGTKTNTSFCASFNFLLIYIDFAQFVSFFRSQWAMSRQQRCFPQSCVCDYFSQTSQWSALACHFAHFVLLLFDSSNEKKAVVSFRNTLSDISTMKCMVCMAAFATSVCNKVAMKRGESGSFLRQMLPVTFPLLQHSSIQAIKTHTALCSGFWMQGLPQEFAQKHFLSSYS